MKRIIGDIGVFILDTVEWILDTVEWIIEYFEKKWRSDMTAIERLQGILEERIEKLVNKERYLNETNKDGNNLVSLVCNGASLVELRNIIANFIPQSIKEAEDAEKEAE